MVVLSYSVIYYIYIPGALGPCFHYWCSVYGICKWWDTLWPVGRVRLFADYTISLSSLCRLIWWHWTIKMLVRYMLPSVCLRLRQFSQLSFVQDMGLCVFSLPNSPVMIVRMCTLSYYHHQTGSMNHYSIMMLVKFLTSATQKHWIWSCDESRLCNPRPRFLGDEVVVGSSLMFRKMDPWNVIRK